jgi:hypothetical protein
MTAKHKSLKRRPSEIAAPVDLDPYAEYGDSSPRLSALVLSEINDGNRKLEDLVNALHALDKSAGANKAQLVELLKSTGETRDALMADLFERYDLKRPKRGRPPRPVYSMSGNNAGFESARGEVAELRAAAKLRGDRLPAADAITRVAEERGIPRGTLDAYVNGQSRSRRKKK